MSFRWAFFCVAFKNVVTSSKKHVSANNPPTQILIKQRRYNLDSGIPTFCTCFLRLRVVFLLPFLLFCTGGVGTHTPLFVLFWLYSCFCKPVLIPSRLFRFHASLAKLSFQAYLIYASLMNSKTFVRSIEAFSSSILLQYDGMQS